MTPQNPRKVSPPAQAWAPRATARPVQLPPPAGVSPKRLSVLSTAYSVGCGGGWITASGQHVAEGVVAMNMFPLGTRVQILSGPLTGAVETVLDRIGYGTELDVWLSSCAAAWQYGKQVVQIEVGGG